MANPNVVKYIKSIFLVLRQVVDFQLLTRSTGDKCREGDMHIVNGKVNMMLGRLFQT